MAGEAQPLQLLQGAGSSVVGDCAACPGALPCCLPRVSGIFCNAYHEPWHPLTGPTTDKRVKPDILAPGTITSAAVGLGSSQDCSLTTMAVSRLPARASTACVGCVRQLRQRGLQVRAQNLHCST